MSVMDDETKYDASAARIYRLAIDPLLRGLHRRTVDVCRDLGVSTVLDIASATGAQCVALHRAGFRTTGVDLSPAMIRVARRRGPEAIRYVEASAVDLPFESGNFDAALLLLALHEHPEMMRRAMLREAQRVVSPDGVLLLAEFSRPRRAALTPAWWLVSGIERSSGGTHAANFLSFVRSGGVRGLEHRAGLVVERRCRTSGGAIELLVCRFHRGAALVYGTRETDAPARGPGTMR